MTTEAASLWPLKPTPFERYMLVEDRSGYSMSFVVVCELDGRADEPVIRAAMHSALLRHPLLTAQLIRKHGRTNWSGPPVEPKIVWHESAPDNARVAPPVPWQGDGGVLLHAFVDQDQTTLCFHFHHAVTDGIGAFQFIGDLLAIYGQQTASTEDCPRLMPVDVDCLKQRDQFDIRIPHPVSRYVAWRAMLSESWRVISRRPSVLRVANITETDRGVDDAADPKLVIEGSALSDYADAADACDVTVNDLLLRDAFITMRRWNASLGATSGKQWLRTTVPTSLRYRKALRMPAANMIGYAFLTHRAAECDDPQQLLTTLSGEMKAITQWGLGVFFVRIIELADKIPGLLWCVSRMSRRFSTLVFSNLGDVARRFRAKFPTANGRIVAGNLVLRNLYGAPPVRPGTRLAIATMGYADQQTFVLRYDRKYFTHAAANSFLDMFRQQLAETAAARKNAGPLSK